MSQNPGTKPNSEIFKIKKKKSSKKKKTLVVKSDAESKVDPRFLLPVEKKFKPKHWELPNRKGFVNWFDIDSVSKPKEPKEQRVVSLRKSDGSIVPLDDYWLKD